MVISPLNLAVLISGRGSNLQALINACDEPDFPASIKVVISNEPDAYGLQRAKQAEIPAHVIPHRSFENKQGFETALLKTISEYSADLIGLAGFMRILSPEFIQKWPGEIINIHPSLLPAYKGLNTHERVIEDSAPESGCTVHYVTPELDSGEIIVQKRVPVLSSDTPEALAERVLEQEHLAYPEAIRILAEKRS